MPVPRMPVLCCRSVAVHSCVSPPVPRRDLEAPLQRFELRVGHAHAAQGRVAVTVFAIAVPVRPATDAESQPLGDARQPLLDGRRMTGMADLDAVQPLVLKDAELRLGAVIA